MSELDFEELENIIDEVLTKDPVQVVEAANTAEVEEVELKATDWKDLEGFEGVRHRKVPARELFNDPALPNALISQYEGFPINVLPVPEIYEAHSESLAALVTSEVTGLKTILVGDTGCGKTSLLEFYAAVTGRPFYRIVWDESTDDQKLYGSLEVKSVDGAVETYFNPAIVTRSMAYPAVCVMDELSAGTSAQTMLINPLLDRNQATITTHDETASQVIEAHPDWLLFATDNAAGNGDDLDLYNSRNVLDQAIINRFDLYQRVPYAPESVERRLISKFSDGLIKEEECKRLAHFSALCHKGFTDRTLSTAFSVRNLMAICKLVEAGYTVKKAIKANYWSRVAKNEQADVQEMVRSVFG